MRIFAVLSVFVWCSQSVLWAQNHARKLPPPAYLILDRRFPGWKFAEVSREVQQYFERDLQGAPPHLISGDFDGNRQPDYAALIWHGKARDGGGKAIGPRSFLVIFLRTGKGYRVHVIKDPVGEYLCLARKGTKDYNYDEQKEITYVNDAILIGIFEKAGVSYVYENGRFRLFTSSD
jgi:hypothetical protein